MKRLRNTFLAIWYTLVCNKFAIRDGLLFVSEQRVTRGSVQFGVRAIPLYGQPAEEHPNAG